MKSLAPDIASLFSVFGGARPRILIEIAATGGTKYYSDQHLFVDGQGYEARILSWGRMSMELGLGEDFIRQGKFPIKLSNHIPKLSDDIDPGDAVSIYLWDLGAAAGSKFKIFEGTVNDNIVAGYEEFPFTCTDVSAKYNKLIGDKLDITTYPSADPNDIGKIEPIPYGANKNSRCLAIEAGAASTLSADINASATTIEIADLTGFPSTDSSADPAEAFIGNERISWTGKSASTGPGNLTGVTRGIDSTTAVPHSRGDGIFQAVDTVKYMASGRIAKELTNARIVPWSSPVSEAVSVDDFSTYRVDDDGIATIELDNLPQIRRNVIIEVTQQPGVSLQQKFSGSPDHAHIAAGNTTITYYMDNLVGTQSGGSNFNVQRMVNKIFADAGQINAYNSFDYKFYKSGIEQYNGIVKQVRAKISTNKSGGGTVEIDMKLYLEGNLKETLDITVDGTSTTYLTSWYSVSSFSWLDFNDDSNNYIQVVSDGGIGVNTLFIQEVWWEVQYLPGFEVETIQDGTIATTGGTEVQIGGDSVAATLGGYLICDIAGEPDIAGHWTGSGTDLIEKPVDIIHHILETFTNGPVAHANIDLTGSFADAETNHPLLDKFGFIITQQIWVEELLTYLAQQFFSRFVWEAGIARLNRIKISSPSSNDRSIDTDWDSIKRNGKLTVKEDRWGKDLVWNDITINFDLDLVLSEGNWFANDNYNQNTQDEDGTSITANGRQTRVFNAFAIGDNSTYADDLRDKLLAFYKVNRKWISFQSWTKLIDLERGDVVDITTPQLGLSSFDAEIVNIEIDFPKRGQSLIPIITALEI